MRTWWAGRRLALLSVLAYTYGYLSIATGRDGINAWTVFFSFGFAAFGVASIREVVRQIEDEA